MTQRMMPHNIEAECGVLGSIIIDPEAIVRVTDFLTAEDFYRDAHRMLYDTILQLSNQRMPAPADFITLCDALERRGHLEDVGGASYITSLINQVPTSGNVEHYGRIVSRTALLRRLIAAGTQMVAWGYEDEEEDAAFTLERTEQLILELSQHYHEATTSSARLSDLLPAAVDRLDRVHSQRGTVVGVPTGFADLDRLTGGFQRSDFIILAGRPGSGKSSFMLSMAYNAALRFQQRVGIFSLEMSKEQLVDRLIAIDSGVDQQRLRLGWVEDDEWERIVASVGTLSTPEIWIDDTGGLSTIQLRSKARRWMLEYGLDLIIIDYLQMLDASPSLVRSKYENRVQEVGAISKALKGLARELNIPVVALAQLSRAVESRQSKIPQLSDLRESGSLEADADIVLFMYRDDMYHPETERPNTADIIIAKHRNGPVGQISMLFDKQQTRFRDLEVIPSSEERSLPGEDDGEEMYLDLDGSDED